jgi:hypothetical protein
MGSHPFYYFTPYQEDIRAALQVLREKEFKAGRYDPAMQMGSPPSYMFQMVFPPDEALPSPGAKHRSIDEAREAAEESGTGSILDLDRITNTPDFCAACRLPDDDLDKLFATRQPTRELLQRVLVEGEPIGDDDDVEDPVELFWEQIDRGQGRYIVVYENSKPSEIFFVGYSFD